MARKEMASHFFNSLPHKPADDIACFAGGFDGAIVGFSRILLRCYLREDTNSPT